jgi:hypothetical protein
MMSPHRSGTDSVCTTSKIAARVAFNTESTERSTRCRSVRTIIAILVLASCGEARTKSPTQPNQPAPRRKVTRALLDDVATGWLPLETLIDPRRGLVKIDFWEGCVQPQAPSAVKLCGDALAAELPAIVARLKAAIESDFLGGFACADAVCRYPTAHCEWGPELRFHVDPTDGVRLDAILELESAAMSEDFIARQSAFVTEQLAALAAQPCR